jgi:hypothetical protein
MTEPVDRGAEHCAETDPEGRALRAIRDLAARQSAELEGLGALLHELRTAVGEPVITLDADAVWQRVLARLDTDHE